MSLDTHSKRLDLGLECTGERLVSRNYAERVYIEGGHCMIDGMDGTDTKTG